MGDGPWRQIDELKRKHDDLFRATQNELEALKATKNSLSVDGYGWWCCRYVPAVERAAGTLRAQSAEKLIRDLREIRAKEEARTKEAANAMARRP